MPSSRKARQAVIELVRERGYREVVELGSGFGHLAIAIARACPEVKVIAYENSFFPWLFSLIARKWLHLPNLSLNFGNYYKADLSNQTAFICYYSTIGIQKTYDKLLKISNLRKDLISICFAVNQINPLITVRLKDLMSTSIYLYQL